MNRVVWDGDVLIRLDVPGWEGDLWMVETHFEDREGPMMAYPEQYGDFSTMNPAHMSPDCVRSYHRIVCESSEVKLAGEIAISSETEGGVR